MVCNLYCVSIYVIDIAYSSFSWSVPTCPGLSASSRVCLLLLPLFGWMCYWGEYNLKSQPVPVTIADCAALSNPGWKLMIPSSCVVTCKGDFQCKNSSSPSSMRIPHAHLHYHHNDIMQEDSSYPCYASIVFPCVKIETVANPILWQTNKSGVYFFIYKYFEKFSFRYWTFESLTWDLKPYSWTELEHPCSSSNQNPTNSPGCINVLVSISIMSISTCIEVALLKLSPP